MVRFYGTIVFLARKLKNISLHIDLMPFLRLTPCDTITELQESTFPRLLFLYRIQETLYHADIIHNGRTSICQ